MAQVLDEYISLIATIHTSPVHTTTLCLAMIECINVYYSTEKSPDITMVNHFIYHYEWRGVSIDDSGFISLHTDKLIEIHHFKDDEMTSTMFKKHFYLSRLIIYKNNR